MSTKKPAPFIVFVRCQTVGYGDSRRPVADLDLSDGSQMRLELGEVYLGNGSGAKLLDASLQAEAFLTNLCAPDAKGYEPSPDSIIRARLESLRSAIKEAQK